MSLRVPSSFGVGEQLFSPRFTITLSDLSAWDRASVLGGRDDQSGFRLSFEQPVAAVADVAGGLLAEKAVEALLRSAQWGGCRVEPTSIGRMRRLGRVAAGQRLDAIATIRYRSEQPDARFVTLMVEVRAGSRRVAEFELCLEVIAPAAVEPVHPPRLQWAAAAAA